jgi:hypothetical protein
MKSLGNICESSLSRIWNKAKNKDFCVFTTFRDEREEDANYNLLKNVIDNLNKNKLSPYLLDGHYEEQDQSNSKVKNITETSLLIVRPEGMEIDLFVDMMMSYLTDDKYNRHKTILDSIYNGEAVNIPQESGLFAFIENVPKGLNNRGYYLVSPNDDIRNSQYLGNTMTITELGQYYSQMKNKEVPFVFEGIRVPTGCGMLTHMLFKKMGINY